MKRLRFCLTLTLAVLLLGSGAWPPAHGAALDSPVPAGLTAVDWQAIQSQVAKLTAADGVMKGVFGASVAVSGDTAVVGASGAAYVFYRDQGGPDLWGQVAKLTAADGVMGTEFRNSVAVSGDTVVVGAAEACAAYVFYRDQGGPDAWGQVAKLTAADGAGNDYFGTSVSVSGDTVVVGVPYGDVVSNDQGAAYVFYRNQGGPDAWGQAAKLIAYDGNDNYWFGYSVSISGDTALIGSNGAWNDTYKMWMGAAYVFYRDQGGPDLWGQVAKLTAPESTVVRFGQAVSASGGTALVGAYATDIDGKFDQGAAYVFYRDQGGSDAWGQVARLTADDGEDNDRFGWSVSVSGNTAVVGADAADIDGNYNQGAAYVFYRDQGGPDAWGQAAKLIASDGAETDRLGWSVSISGDTVVGGALYVDYGDNTDQGAAYVFYGEPSAVAPDSVTISGATQGAVGTSYPFTAIVSPENATLPITYVWQATEQAPVTHTGGLTDLVTFAWATTGAKAINVTATNAGGEVIGTHTIQIYLGIAHVQDISMRYRAFRNGRYDVFADVQVLGQDNLPVHKATVHILWTLPGGSQQAEQATTNKKGLALFKLRSELVGTYDICVVDVAMSDWFYDSSQNLQTCAALSVP